MHIYLFEQCISGLLLVKSDEAKVFGFAVLAAVNRPLDFNNLTVLGKMLSNNVFGDGGVFELANVNLALFECGLFNSHFNKCESSGSMMRTTANKKK